MAEWSETFGATKAEATLLVVFIPSVSRHQEPVGQMVWVDRALTKLGSLFGGATAFPRALGVWRDDERGGVLVFDEPVVIQCYTNEEALEQYHRELADFLPAMGSETEQGAVGFVIDDLYLEIRP